MTEAYLLALIGTLLLLVAIRIVVPGLPVQRWTRPIRRLDALLVLVGDVGLVLHCAAMFARPFAMGIPGVSALVPAVNALGTTSLLLYIAPAALVLVGLRRLWPPVPAVVLIPLVAVGVTMYDGGPLRVHLAAISVAVVLLAAAPLLFVSAIGPAAPARRRRGLSSRM